MWGPGVAVNIINILPFAFVLGAPFMYRRNNLLGINPFGNSRQYFRQWWVRVFFGKFQYIFYTSIAGYLLKDYFYLRHVRQAEIDYFTAFSDDYDESKSHRAEAALYSYLYKNKLKKQKDALLEYRAQKDHDLKIEAFNKYEMENLEELKDLI